MRKALHYLLIFSLATASWLPTRSLHSSTLKERFNAAVAQLQADPDNLDLRKDIIAMAQGLDSPPAKPEDAVVFEGKAVYLLKNAAGTDDYLAAAKAFKKASLLAPWDAVLYYNQGLMEQKGKLPQDAIREFKLYLLAKPDAEDHADVLARIGRLQAESEKQDSDQQNAEQKRKLEQENAEARQDWQNKQTGANLVLGTGIALACIGAAVAAWGFGTASGADYTTAPGYSSGVDYYKFYEGKYWSDSSYSAITAGQTDMTWGGALLGVGVVGIIIGAVMNPGPYQPRTALLNLKDGNLAWGVPDLDLSATGGAGKLKLLRAEF